VITSSQRHLFLPRYHHPSVHLPSASPGSSGPAPSSFMATNPVNGGQNNAPPAVKISAPTNGWTRKDRPCDACRRRKSRCIIPQDAETCIICQSRSEECTFVQTPQRRKRRKLDDEASPDASNPRYARRELGLETRANIVQITGR
jgi:hypothetical protein